MGDDRLSIGLLGPLEVRLHDDGRTSALDLPGGKPRSVLACLALSAGRTVSVERLTERLWSADHPPRARGSLQNNVLRLRRLLGAEMIKTTTNGYRLAIHPDCVDALRMTRLLEAANRAEPASARAMLAKACGLWRGDPLTGVVSESLERDYVPVLTERYLSGLERRVDLDLALGTAPDVHAGLVAELRELTARFPLRESLWERLLHVLMLSGRQAEALEAFEDLRTLLAEALGTDPSARLRLLHRRILAETSEGSADEAPGRPPDPALPPLVPVPAPAHLPFDVPDFLGRDEELRDVGALLTGRRDTLPVAVISGPPGVGKTTFAVHVAHLALGAFPDGQLYAQLSDADGRPRQPRGILAAFLRALGAAPNAIPEALEERASLYRSLLRGRRILIVLDNATSEAQVRPLLPGGSDAAVLVTSRSRLAGLAGARFVTLGVLDTGQALGLLSAVAGPERFADDAESGRAIAELCGHLPLAIRIAGSRLAARPHWRARDLAERLGDERNRLDELTQGDLEVRASLEVGYEGLAPPLRRAFRRLGLLHATTFPSWPVSAVLDCPADRAEELMEQLTDAGLLEVAGRDSAGQVRYRFHDLLLLFARERADAEESAVERDTAVARVLEGWLAAARTAATALPKTFPGPPPEARTWEPAVAATQDARSDVYAWFDSERTALEAAIEQACELAVRQHTREQAPQPSGRSAGGADVDADVDTEAAGRPAGGPGAEARPPGAELPAALAASISSYLDARGYFDEWRRVYEVALAAARRTGHHAAQVALLCDLGEVHCVQDRIHEARVCFAEAENLAREIGDTEREAMVSSSLGYLARLRSDYPEASKRYRLALTLAQEAGDLLTQAHATQGLGNIDYDQGRYTEAEQRFGEALALARESGFVVCTVRALRGLALVARHRGELERAIAHVRLALAELDRHDNALGRAHACLDLADLYRLGDRPEEARALYDECLPVFEQHSERFGVALVRQGLGMLHAGREEYALAREQLERAAGIFADLELPLWHARSLDDLCQVVAACGDDARAAELAALARDLTAQVHGRK